MSKILTQQRFLPPQISQSLPTFRQIGNYMNSISSASTIFLERDNTHTRLQSELKLNSNKPSLDLEAPSSLPARGESGILSYSQTTSSFQFEDALQNLKRLLALISSKENMNNHIKQSLALTGFNIESAKNIAKIVAQSFTEYIQIAMKIDEKIIRDEFITTTSKINELNKVLVELKQQNLQLFQKAIKLQSYNSKYRTKMAILKEKQKNPQNAFMIINHFKQQFAKIMNKMTVFESQIFQKFVVFQDALISVTNLRNKLVKHKKNSSETIMTCKQNEKQNKKVHLALEMKSNMQRSAMKEINKNNQVRQNQIQISKKALIEKSQEISRLNAMIQTISQQLGEQKNLYEQMLDKNIELEKEIFFLKCSKSEKQSDQSFCIIDGEQAIKYMTDELHEL